MKPAVLSSTPADPPDRGSGPDGETVREDERRAEGQSGDEAAFEQLFRAYFDRLQAYAERYVRRPSIAEEVVGEVFLRLWNQPSGWRTRQSLKSYLYTAVRNQSLSWLDHQQVVLRTREAGARDRWSPGMGEYPPAADEAVQAVELAEAVQAAIARLPERVREAYVLQRQHGLSYAEIAVEMGVSRKTVEIHLGRALKLLREELAPFLRP